MSIRKVIFSLALFILVYSCAYTTAKSKPFEISISKSPTEASPIEIKILKGTFIDKGSYYDLKFEGLKYGERYFFGKKSSTTSPNEHPRLELVKDGNIIAKYSINELQKMNHQMIGDSVMVYLIPELQ